jgi:hypothetical protein
MGRAVGAIKVTGRAAFFGTITVAIAVFIGYVSYFNRAGLNSAEQLCASIHVGETATSVRLKMTAAGRDPKMTDFSSDFMSVMFWGALGERYACNVRLQNGVVKQTETHHLD